MKFSKKYAVYNIIVGALFAVIFGGIAGYACISLSSSHNGFQTMNAIFMLIIGLLGLIDGIKIFIKGIRATTMDKLG